MKKKKKANGCRDLENPALNQVKLLGKHFLNTYWVLALCYKSMPELEEILKNMVQPFNFTYEEIKTQDHFSCLKVQYLLKIYIS